MTNKKVIIKDIEKMTGTALEMLWDVERNYRDVHHVMKILKDGSPIVKNPEGAMVILAVERYFEKHKDEEDFNDLKKIIHEISDIKLKLIELMEISINEDQEKSEKAKETYELMKKTAELQKSIDNLEVEEEKEINVEIPADQEMDITLRPTPVREDLLKPKTDVIKQLAYESMTSEEWNKFRGEKLDEIYGLYIRKNVVNEIKENMGKGVRYTLDNTIPKYYPLSTRRSHGIYVRAYYKYLGKKAIIPETWIREKSISKEITEKPQLLKLAKDVEEIEYSGQLSDDLYKKYECRPNTKNLAILLDALTKNDTLTRREASIATNVNENRTYTHLRYAEEMGYTKLYKNKYNITEKGKQKLKYLLGAPVTLTKKELEKPEFEMPEALRKRFDKIITKKKKSRKVKGRKIAGKIAQRINKTYSTRLTFKRYLTVLEAVQNNPRQKDTFYKKGLDMPKSAAYAHLRYGVEIGDLASAERKYILRSNGHETIKKLKKKYGKTEKTEEPLKKMPRPSKMDYEKRSEHFDNKYGEKIEDDIANKLAKTTHWTIRRPTYEKVRDHIKNNPGENQKEMSKELNMNQGKLNAHIKYGLETDEIYKKDARYFPKKKEETKQEIEKVEETITPKVTLDGTPIKDNIAQNIHIKYGSPVIQERYTKIKNILESAIFFKKTVPQIAEHTGWSKHNVYIHMLYGMRTKEIIECGQDGTNKEYCLKKFKDKVIKPKEVRAKNKSWLKPKDKSESLWRKNK